MTTSYTPIIHPHAQPHTQIHLYLQQTSLDVLIVHELRESEESFAEKLVSEINLRREKTTVHSQTLYANTKYHRAGKFHGGKFF